MQSSLKTAARCSGRSKREGVKDLSTGETFRKWHAENAKDITIRFNVKGDADILEAIERRIRESGESRSAIMKNWLRIGIDNDKVD